jgi:hypothetical protein
MYDTLGYREVSRLNQKDKASEKSLLSLDARIAATWSYDRKRDDDGWETISGEGSVVLWETETGREIAAFPWKRVKTTSVHGNSARMENICLSQIVNQGC